VDVDGLRRGFQADVASRLATRVQVTTDGHKLEAVEGAFGMDVDFAQLVKLYGEAPEASSVTVRPSAWVAARTTSRVRPRACVHVLCGAPEPNYEDEHEAVHRLTNAFSKKVENHEAAVSVYSLYYNFGNSLHAPGDPGDGSWDCRPRLDFGRNRGALAVTILISSC